MTIDGNLGIMATSPLTSNRSSRGGSDNTGSGTWFEALARSWGQTLDNQAQRIETMSDNIGNMGTDSPADVTKLTAESLRMSFLSQSSSSSIDSVGKALETMARKG
jgi:hypothetical protein